MTRGCLDHLRSGGEVDEAVGEIDRSAIENALRGRQFHSPREKIL